MTYSYSIQGGSAPAFPPREFIQQQQRQQQQRRQQQQQQRNQFDQYNQYQPDHHLQQQKHLQVRETALPQSSSHHPNRDAKRFSHRPTSSVYSQTNSIEPSSHSQQQQHLESSYGYADPRTQYLEHSRAQSQKNADGVSPESSPELSATVYPYNDYASNQYNSSPYHREPSPFDMSAMQAVQPMDSATGGRSPSASRTTIPSIHGEQHQTQEAATRTLRETKSREHLQPLEERTSSMSSTSSKRGYKGGEVRWDPRTGELTSSQKGRPSQVKPIEFVRGLAKDVKPASPTESAHKEKEPASELASFVSRLRKTSKSAGSDRAAPPVPDEPLPISLRPVSTTAAPHVPSPSPGAVLSPSDSTDPAAGAFTSNRPAWHGASGRTTLVAPVYDTPDAAPLNIPRRSSKRGGSVLQLQKAMDAAKAASNAARLASPSHKNGSLVSPPVSPSPQGLETQAMPRKATAASGQVTKKSFASPTPASPMHSYPSPPLQEQQSSSEIRRKPTPSHQNLASFDASDPFNYNNRSNPTIAAPPPELRRPLHEATEWTQPTSQPSVATYNSTIHEPATEFDSNNAPGMPPSPEPLRSGSSVMSRRRPIGQSDSNSISELKITPPRRKPAPIIIKPAGGDSVMDRSRPPRLGHSPKTPGVEPVVINLNTLWVSGKRTPAQENAEAGDDLDNADGASSAGSIHKSLPPAPPETSAKDRVAILNAQLSSLAHRRMNINRGIKQMTELMPTDNLLAAPDVLSKREMEKRKVEGLRAELAEIHKQEYEIGLKLHRAYKRLDKNAEYEPTTLWVRRVTG